jgi:hypothetical protein
MFEVWDCPKGASGIADEDRLDWMRSVDMAVVVSQGQNEIDDLKQRGFDILPHCERMLNSCVQFGPSQVTAGRALMVSLGLCLLAGSLVFISFESLGIAAALFGLAGLLLYFA